MASLLIVFSVQCGVVDKIRRRSPISLKHVCVRCLISMSDEEKLPNNTRMHTPDIRIVWMTDLCWV